MDAVEDIVNKRIQVQSRGLTPKYLIVNEHTFSILRIHHDTYFHTTPQKWEYMGLLIAVIPYSDTKEYYAEVV